MAVRATPQRHVTADQHLNHHHHHHHHHHGHDASEPQPRFRLATPNATRLLLSAPVSANVTAAYFRSCVGNWLQYTRPSSRVVLHMDAARPVDFATRSLPAEWAWLRDGERILVNEVRLHTRRRFGSILAAHLHNCLYASRRNVSATHFVFVATNVWFVRPGLDAFVGERQATLALRACATSAAARANPPKVRPEQCSRYGWLAAMTRSPREAVRIYAHMVEGSFFPLAWVAALAAFATSHDAAGRLSVAPPTMLEDLPAERCTAEEGAVSAFVVHSDASRALAAAAPQSLHTEPVCWLPRSLAANAVADLPTVRELSGARGAHWPRFGVAVFPWCNAGTDAARWPATKFLAKRVSVAPVDPTGVRAFLGEPSRTT